MTRQLLALTLAAALVAVAPIPGVANQAPEREREVKPPIPTQAVAVLQPTKDSKVRGVILLTERNGKVRITGQVRNLSPGKHGFHIHEYGDLRSRDGSSAGDHYAPDGHKHGAPGDEEHHAGDLGNIEANQEGVAKVDIEADWLKLHFIVGRSIVVHAKADDLESQPSGDAGDRVALGVIGFAQVKDQRKRAAAR